MRGELSGEVRGQRAEVRGQLSAEVRELSAEVREDEKGAEC
jgi:hypothetical protein